ncbi:MAG TPA: LPS export ABC transporter periplasmic protein LptC [Thermoanaerobaculia bacterium]|jgi:LPS export ABC transporter protein LptC/lipopolysaccharide transport protein LptA|nr:LPS export ABC transporter periplasmic protein LptC [Thermoanaerobaculia bacterium]
MARRGILTVARIKAARWIALGVAAALLALIALLWFLGRAGKPELTTSEAENPRNAQQVGKGFDHTITHEGKPLLRIRGKRDRYDKQGDLHVEEVLITAYQQDGSHYEVAADVATYNLQQKQAILEGHVSLAGPQGFALRTKKLTLKQGGRWLHSDSQVNFQWGLAPPIAGRAQELAAQINRGEFVLSGGVGLRSMQGQEAPAPAPAPASTAGLEGEPFSMSAEVIVFQRPLHQLRADGKVLLKHGTSHLQADRLAVHLSPEENKLQFVRARWHVEGTFHDVDASGRNGFLIAEGDSLSVLFDDAGKLPTRIEIEGEGKQASHLRRGVDGGSTLDLLAPQTQGDLAAGRLTTAHSAGGVTLVQETPQAPPRKLTARTADAELASDGTLAQVEVRGNVHVDDPGRGQLAAARAVVTPDRTDAYGAANDPVHLDSPRGNLRAPQITYTRGEGVAHATGGVEATLPPGKGNPMEDTPLAGNDQPVQVQAEEAFWRDQPQSFTFKGKVRAWSGDRVIRADQLRGDNEQQQLAASGSVQTLWFLPPPKADAGAPAGTGPRQVRVDAGTLVYSDREHRLVYSDGVRVVDGLRTLNSKDLTVELTAKGQARRMLATGEVKLEAPAEGRTITAERADYDVESRRVVFRGSPVTLVDKKGGTLSGKQAVYSMETAKVRVTAEAEEAPAAAAPGGGAR